VVLPLPRTAAILHAGRGFKVGDFYARHSLAGDADFLRSTERKVETAPSRAGTAIIDDHPYRVPVVWILDADDRTKRQGLRRRGKLSGIEQLPTSSWPSGKFASIP
jgi:hypothetical protein